MSYGDVETFYPDRKPQAGDDNMNVTFEIKQVYDKRASEGWTEEVYDQEKGRIFVIKHDGAGVPIYKPVEWITLWSPADRDNISSRPVWNDPRNPKSDTVRFAKHYEAWKRGVENFVSGTPIQVLSSVVPRVLDETQVAEFKHYGVNTVEALAEMSDAIGQRFRGFAQLREKVRNYLEHAKAEAPAANLRAELERRDLELATLRKALEDQGAMIAKLAEGRDEDESPKRRVRSAKQPEVQP